MFDHYFSLGKSKPMNTDWNEEWLSYDKQSSQIISIQDLSDQPEPVLASIDLRFRQRIDNLRLLRLRGKVTELRQMQEQMRKYVKKEVQVAIEAMRLQIMTLYRQSVQINTQHQSQLIRKEVEINQLTRQKQELAQNLSLQQERLRNLKAISQQGCNKCEQLGARLTQQEREKRSLQEENQKLQESIFDLEQQVVGVELEIQRRLKETPLSEDKITQWMRKFQLETQQLQARCQHYESICVQQDQLGTKKKRLEKQEAEIRTKEDALIESLTKLHSQQEQTYLREHQVTLAEENMTRKIAELRRKEAQLIEWQAKLSQGRYQSPRPKSPQSTSISIPRLMINKSRQYEPTHHRDYERYDHRQRERREYIRLASPIRKESPKMSLRNGTTIYRQTTSGNQIGGRGLGPKLQRLRCELKRQIESIR